MKLGTETGSLVNHLQSRAVIGQPEAKVGMGATILRWTDRHAGTIVEALQIGGSKKWDREIVVQRDHAKRTDELGLTDSGQEWVYSANPQGARHLFKRDKASGVWVAGAINPATGKFCKSGGGVHIGERDEYFDPSF